MSSSTSTFGIPSTQATDAEVTSAISTHESDTSSVHGITDTTKVALTTAANVFTASPQQITADDAADVGLLVKHASTNPSGPFVKLTDSDNTERVIFGGPGSDVGGWGFKLTGAGTVVLEATNRLLYCDSGQNLTIGSSALTNGVLIGAGTGCTLGFFGTSPVAKQTGVAVSAAGIHAALVAYGIIAGP